MAVGLTQLNQVNRTFELGGMTYTLRKFDLYARVWAQEEFRTEAEPDGVTALAKRLSEKWNDLPVLTKTIWHLLEEKVSFGTYERFIKAIENDKKNTQLIITQDLYPALLQTLTDSKPDDGGEEAEVKKFSAAVS